MPHIIAHNLSLIYPSYGVNKRSLKHSLLRKISVGGKIQNQENNTVIVRALQNISFELKSGDRLALLGHNGAGKSTLLRVLAGIYQPSHGSLQIEGKISTLLDLSAGLFPEATGYENINIRAHLLDLPSHLREQLIQEVEEFTDIGQFLAMPVHTYSSGMMVRLSFALSTLMAHDIMLIDEAVGAGDNEFMKKAQARIENLINQSEILVLASHSPDIIRKFCNKALWLEHGQIKAMGSIEEILPNFEG